MIRTELQKQIKSNRDKSVEGFKITYLKSDYESNHKNTFNSFTPKSEQDNFSDYTTKMLRRIFNKVNIVTKVNKNIFEVASFIE